MVSPAGADPDLARRIQQACLERGLLLLTCGTFGNVIRWVPPLVVTEGQIAAALEIMDDAFEEIFDD